MEALVALLGLGVAAAAPFLPGLRPVAKVVVKSGMAVVDATVTVAAAVAEEVNVLAVHLRESRTGEADAVDTAAAAAVAGDRGDTLAADIGAEKASDGEAGAEFAVADVSPLADSAAPAASEASVVYTLTDVNGVGPKTAALLQEAGITTVAQLAGAPVDRLKTMLGQAGPNYRVVDPSIWPANAQALLDAPPPQPKPFDDNDLVQIDGIGPKTASLLFAAGIDTVSQLAATPIEQVRAILDQAGSRFRIVDPSAWPARAQALLPAA